MSTPHRFGTAALVGRPNVGKSTLLNRVLGQKVSITSPKAQTTRTRVVGIYTGPNEQIVLLDTPCHHEAWSPMNRSMVRAAEGALAEVDVVVLLVDLEPAAHQAQADRPVLSVGEEVLLNRVLQEGKPVILALNKADAIHPAWALPVIEAWRAKHEFLAIVPFSARTGLGVETLLAEIRGALPEGPQGYNPELVTDQPERVIVAELIRERLFHHLQRELPYSIAVEIERFDETERESEGKVQIFARILVERTSQRAIVLGKGGSMIKKIGTEARLEINKLLDARTHLELHVTVQPDWTRKPRQLRELGLPDPS